ncbi:MAG: biotin-independent malonate decarboxylase subunit beta, partial [Chlamydiales bacterium]
MQSYQYHYQLKHNITEKPTVKVGVAGSGNLEVIVRSSKDPLMTEFTIKTTISGFEATWKAVIDRFAQDYPYSGLSFLLQDAGATPPVVALRLRQAFETYQSGYLRGKNYIEMDARERIYSLVDENSFREFLLDEDCHSPHLQSLRMQTEEDDGVVIGIAQLDGKQIGIASQQKNFIGGSVGEVHGAKINGLVKYAVKNRLEAVVLLIDSGGVRLQEANVGEIEISEIIRSILEGRSSGVKMVGVICGNNGAFGGMGILSGVMDALIVNQTARIGVSGAEVIQAMKGVEAFDASDRPLIWRVYGGRTRFMQHAADYYTSNQVSDISKMLVTAMHELDSAHLINFETVLEEQKRLQTRIQSAGNSTEQGEWLKAHLPKGFDEDL